MPCTSPLSVWRARRLALILLAAWAASNAHLVGGVRNPEEFVNTLGGTNSTAWLSHGNTLPLVVRPWGMNAWAPDTKAYAEGFWFHPDDKKLWGIRCTHQPSPWMGDYGQFWILPSIVEGNGSDSFNPVYWSFMPLADYEPAESTWKPYLWSAAYRDPPAPTPAPTYAPPSHNYAGPPTPKPTYPPLPKGPWPQQHPTAPPIVHYYTPAPTPPPPEPVPQQGVKVDLTATDRGAAIRVRFPAPPPHAADLGLKYRIAVHTRLAHSDKVNASIGHDGRPFISGFTQKNSGGVPLRCHKKGHVKMCEDVFWHFLHLTVEGKDGAPLPRGAVAVQNVSPTRAEILVAATEPLAEELTIRVATSYISAKQAEVNHKREVDKKPFDSLVQEAKDAWRKTLARVNVLDVGPGYSKQEESELLEVFYSSLYRATQFPRLLHEITEDGQSVHYSPYDSKGRVLPGFASTDSGFWDAYRAVYPLLSLVYPDQLGKFVQGWLAAWKESGWLPKWPSPGERGGMSGTLGDAVLADAIVKAIPGFNRTEAYQAIRQDAFVAPPPPRQKVRWYAPPPQYGRSALKPYLQRGYLIDGELLPEGRVGDVVSKTLDYMLSDAAVANAAQVLGHHEDARVLRKRASEYPKLFDQRFGFFRPKTQNGSFVKVPFKGGEEFAWGNGFIEGGPWQYRFSVPYDPIGLAALYKKSGLDMCHQLEQMMTSQTTFGPYNHFDTIHEQTEMVRNCWGQYAHNNQVVHHVLYLFTALGGNVSSKCAARGQFWLRKALLELYKGGASMYSGDEDNGDMGAWFVLSSLGLYQLEPGHPLYTLGSPLFARVSISLPQGRELIIAASGNHKRRPYVRSVSWVDVASCKVRPMQRAEVPHDLLVSGGELHFNMSEVPATTKQSEGAAAIAMEDSMDAECASRLYGSRSRSRWLAGSPGVLAAGGALLMAVSGAACVLRWQQRRQRTAVNALHAPLTASREKGSGHSPSSAEGSRQNDGELLPQQEELA